MATVRGESTVEIAASPAVCWGLLADPAAYPQWYDTLDEVDVEGRDEAGRAALVSVRSHVGPPIGSIEFRLALTYADGEVLSGRQVGKGAFVKDVVNEWRLKPLGATSTQVTYALSASSDGMRAAAAFSAAAASIRRALIDGFAHALKVRAERDAAGA